MSPGRTLLAFTVTAGLYALASYPVQLASLYLLRETYRLCEFTGVMNPAGDLGGQVMGFNFQRNPAWVHTVARPVSVVLAGTPALALFLLVYHRIAFGPLGLTRTLCGSCGAPRRSDTPCSCGHDPSREPNHLAAGPLARRFGPARAVLIRRLFIACAAAAPVVAWLVVYDDWYRLRMLITELGERLGGQVEKLGRIVIGPDGPFFGDDLRATVLNFAYRHGPHVIIHLSDFIVAVIVYHVGAAWLWRSRFTRALFGYSGPTLCGRCRYRLSGIRSGRCPECGAS